MMAAGSAQDIREEVRAYYDSVGWRQIGEGLYENARNEDLRPVAQEYIQRCHQRVGRHIAGGVYLLDAGSGPIQYPAYLAYSDAHRYRVCLDISRRALQEARARIGARGLFVIGDLAALPFAGRRLDGAVSLHVLHHLAPEDQARALSELRRVLSPGRRAVVVHSWGSASGWMRAFRPLLAASIGLRRLLRREGNGRVVRDDVGRSPDGAGRRPSFKQDYGKIAGLVRGNGGGEILVWRSVSTEFTRNLIHPRLAGRWMLRAIYALEEAFPRWFGRHGMYPMILLDADDRDGTRG